MYLKSIADISNLAKGFTWQSGLKIVRDIRFILFALATGDWNRIHINPLTAWLYKSNLKGLTCSGDFVLALTKPGIHKVLCFGEDVEIIACGYENVELRQPLHLGMRYSYSYTLVESFVRKGKAYCTWSIKMKDLEDNHIAVAIWKMLYVPVERCVTMNSCVQIAKEFFVALWHDLWEWACVSIMAIILIIACLNSPVPSLGP